MMNEQNNKKNIAITVAMVAVALVIGYVLTGLLFFNNHFNFGTKINGVKCAGKTADDTIKAMNGKIMDYKILITDNADINEEIYAQDIGLHYNYSDKINEAMQNQNPMMWGFGFIGKDITVENAYACSDEKLQTALNELDFVKNQTDTPATNATIYFNGEQYEIQEGQHGGKVIMENLRNAVETAAINPDEKDGMVDLIETGCFEIGKYNANSTEVIAACKQANEYIKPKITMNMGAGAEHIIIDKEIINTWLFVTDDYNVYFDRKKVKEYVAEFAKGFDTYGMTREFLTAFGSRTTVKGGDFGWRINQEQEVQSLVNVVKAGKDVVRYPVYYTMGIGHGENDWGKSYAEVDLTNQHIYVWIDGKRVLDAPCVTGLPPSRITPQGTYVLKKKMSPAILVGEDYRTPVKYWMPFNRGIGFHDATWQSSFGGKRYLYAGSHGCVNLSLSTAGQVYKYVYPGMPVICYYTNEVGVGKMMELPDLTTTTTTTTETTTIQTTIESTTETTTIQTTTVKPTQATTVKPTQATTVKPTQATTQAPPPQTTVVVTENTNVIIEETVEQTTKKKEETTDIIVEPIVS